MENTMNLKALLLALDYFPGTKRIFGAGLYFAALAATFYNGFAPSYGFPEMPADMVSEAKAIGEAVFIYGAATAAVR